MTELQKAHLDYFKHLATTSAICLALVATIGREFAASDMSRYMVVACWGFLFSLVISLLAHHDGMTDRWTDPQPGKLSTRQAKVGGLAVVTFIFSAFFLAMAATYGIEHPKTDAGRVLPSASPEHR